MRRFLICCFLAALFCLAQSTEVRFGPNNAFRLEFSKGTYRLQASGIFEGNNFYPLPQSTLESYIRLRPADIRINPISATGGHYEREEFIGPWQIEGDRFWFGNNFYDGEGERGVGAFGYFDASTRGYEMFSPPEIAPFEITAILVEPDTVWVGLDHSGEAISPDPGGFAEWNRTTHAVHRYDTEFEVSKIERSGDSLRLTSIGGYAVLHEGKIARFKVENGKAVSIERFPPLPTNQ